MNKKIKIYAIILGWLYTCLGISEILNWISNFTEIIPADIFSGVVLLVIGLVFVRTITEEDFMYGGAVLSGIFLGIFVILSLANFIGYWIEGGLPDYLSQGYIKDLKTLFPWFLALPLLLQLSSANEERYLT